MGGSDKVQIYAHVIYGWSLRKYAKQNVDYNRTISCVFAFSDKSKRNVFRIQNTIVLRCERSPWTSKKWSEALSEVTKNSCENSDRRNQMALKFFLNSSRSYVRSPWTSKTAWNPFWRGVLRQRLLLQEFLENSDQRNDMALKIVHELFKKYSGIPLPSAPWKNFDE